MKSITGLGLALVTAASLYAAGQPAHALSACNIKGIQLFGEGSVVAANADLTVEIVPSGGDLKVHWVNRHANQCGEWRRVGLGADFTIQVVPSGGELKIQEVTSGPGLQ